MTRWLLPIIRWTGTFVRTHSFHCNYWWYTKFLLILDLHSSKILQKIKYATHAQLMSLRHFLLRKIPTLHIECCAGCLWWFVVVCSSTLYRLCVVCSVSCYNDGGCICSLYASDICRTQVPGYGRSRDSITVDYTLDYFLDAFSYCQWIVTRNQGNIMNIYCGI